MYKTIREKKITKLYSEIPKVTEIKGELYYVHVWEDSTA